MKTYKQPHFNPVEKPQTEDEINSMGFNGREGVETQGRAEHWSSELLKAQQEQFISEEENEAQ